jgi:tRNA threonylcarbamoyladenosine biosynthesis protein TsaB
MILAIDTSTAACTTALFDRGGICVAWSDELIGRGHAERLAPMLAELLDGRAAKTILVGIGPGSFTGIRVGIAAAHGLAIGWNAELMGMSSLALLAASAQTLGQADGLADGDVAAAMAGGHGELFVQQFDRKLNAAGEILNLPPAQAAAAISADPVAGPGARALVEARRHGTVMDCWPSAAHALKLPEALRSLAPAPLYARAPDAKAGCRA